MILWENSAKFDTLKMKHCKNTAVVVKKKEKNKEKLWRFGIHFQIQNNVFRDLNFFSACQNTIYTFKFFESEIRPFDTRVSTFQHFFLHTFTPIFRSTFTRFQNWITKLYCGRIVPNFETLKVWCWNTVKTVL